MRRSSALLALVLSLAAIGPVIGRQSEAFIVAIVRDDGVMLPVATADRGRWRMPWPAAAKEAEVPVRLEDCPLAWWGLAAPPTSWTLHVPDLPPRPITVDRVTWVPTYCQQQVVVQSRDAQRAVMRPLEDARVPKHGVAVTGQASLTRPRRVEPDSSEGRALLDAIQRAFNREERLMLARDYFTVYQPSVDGGERDRMPVTGLSIHAGPSRTGDAYYVELERRYPRRSPQDLQWCDEVTYMTGWAHRRAGGDQLDLSLIGIDVTSCRLDSVVRVVPHAIFDSPKGPVWLFEEYRPEGEAYSVYLSPDRQGADLIARRFAGLCSDRR